MNQSDKKLISKIENTPFLKDITKEMYTNRIKDVQEKMHSNKRISDILLVPEDFQQRLDKFCDGSGKCLGPSSRELFTASMMALWKHNQDLRENNVELFERWQKVLSAVRGVKDAKYKSNEPNEKEQLAYISFPELAKIRDQLPDGIGKLFLAMNTYIPPQRSDHMCTRIFKKPPPKDFDGNYIVYGNQCYMVLQKFKTDKKYKEIRVEFPDALVRILRASLKQDPRRYLYVGADGTCFRTERAYNQFANRLLRNVTGNKHISLNTLRHIYISNPGLKLETLSTAEREKIGNLMGHSVRTQQDYLWHIYDKR